ncbi:MAG: YopX family protein [Streptococcus sp.]|nr:YopX family protein [Streptococcus sp.]
MIPKFRAWDKDHKYMEYTDKNLVVCFSDEGVEVTDHTTFSHSCISMEKFELMQSTGLKDITGDEIYEGDIVKILVHDIEPKIMKDKMYIGVVAYNQGTFDIKISKDTYLGIIPEMYMLDIDCVFRILGNIYENPELLEDN